MDAQKKILIDKAYAAFNKRDIESVLDLMHENVHWPNGWEGGYVEGRHAVKEYWIRQWKEIEPYVTPISIIEKDNGTFEVNVQQVIKDLRGNLLFDGQLKHVYSFESNLIKGMEIEKP